MDISSLETPFTLSNLYFATKNAPTAPTKIPITNNTISISIYLPQNYEKSYELIVMSQVHKLITHTS